MEESGLIQRIIKAGKKLAIGATLAATLASPLRAQDCGDCNGDHNRDILDALTASQYAVGQISLPPIRFAACNVTGTLGGPEVPNAEVNILDALNLAQYLVAIQPTPTCIFDNEIVFVSDRDGNVEIYKMETDGSNQTRLTYNPEIDFQPDVSPDGTKIAFSRIITGAMRFYPQLYVMNIDGTQEQLLTTAFTADHGYPKWSPDGQKILFQSERSGNLEIYVMDAVQGALATQLTNDPGVDIWGDWSPDGQTIVFCSDRTGGPGGQEEIYTMDTNGQNITQITSLQPNELSDMFPSWNPDGSAIAFSRRLYLDPRLPAVYGNFRINPNGTNLFALGLPRNEIIGGYLRNGERIIYRSPDGIAGFMDIYTTDALTGSQDVNLTNTPMSGEGEGSQ